MAKKPPTDHWGRTDLTLCQRWERGGSRPGVCRNKRYADTYLCRRHIIEDLRKFERDHPNLRFYLDHRDLLDG